MLDPVERGASADLTWQVSVEGSLRGPERTPVEADEFATKNR